MPPLTVTRVALQAFGGQYVSAMHPDGHLVVVRPTIGAWETFDMIELGTLSVALRADTGKYVSADGGGGGDLHANAPQVGPAETFAVHPYPNQQVALQAADGHFIAAAGGGGRELVANRPTVGPWEKFKVVPRP